ncbi:MAG: DUF115 domain-containing protein [Rhizobiales bacterium]|nr:DUF115 domain-containing protein [Hyphomicrobiales bacterium]
MPPETQERERGGQLLLQLQKEMDRITSDRTEQLALENARNNLPFIKRGKSIKDLRGVQVGVGDTAVVIAAGPSAKIFNPAGVLKANNYKGAVIASESAMSHCLLSGLVPDLVVSVDPHPIRIVRWFGDPELNEKALQDDDYFRRQDLDPSFAAELAHNRKMIDLLDRHGKDIKIALSTSASMKVVERVHQIGMQVFWWNPMVDNPDDPDSATTKLCRENGLPAVNAGGNVGTACWMLAHALLNKKRVAVTGMDLGYYGDLPYDKTQYYHELVKLVGLERLDEVFIHLLNPHTNTWFYTDPAYYWYRQAFLELAQDADCTTYNCSGGGTLFHESIPFIPLEQFIELAAG